VQQEVELRFGSSSNVVNVVSMDEGAEGIWSVVAVVASTVDEACHPITLNLTAGSEWKWGWNGDGKGYYQKREDQIGQRRSIDVQVQIAPTTAGGSAVGLVLAHQRAIVDAISQQLGLGEAQASLVEITSEAADSTARRRLGAAGSYSSRVGDGTTATMPSSGGASSGGASGDGGSGAAMITVRLYSSTLEGLKKQQLQLMNASALTTCGLKLEVSSSATTVPAVAVGPRMEEDEFLTAACPRHSTTLSVNTSELTIYDCLGDGGYFDCSSGACVEASFGFYSPEHSNARVQCPSHSTTAVATASHASECLGDAGYHCAKGVCTEAGTGRFSAALTNDRVECPGE
jgi:hypothetical protein